LIATIAGGVGIFLLGMILLTDGLKAAAGDALRRTLERFTGGRVSALLSGAAVTAVVQSSSATTLATIGFVSAGLLSFPSAVGVIFGANLGTTSTGWIVAVLGLRLRIGELAMPLVAVGALLRLLGRGRTRSLGLALAGFGLIFLGIEVLQGGMSGLAAQLDPSRFPGATFAGRILLVILGAVMTVVLQSSSAAVATTLTALHSGALQLEQAALLVIGQNMGTTVKSALAAVGAAVPARRTAVAHILFNVFTGVVALLILPGFLAAERHLLGGIGVDDPAVVLAGFHTAFNLLGVLLLLPVVHHFARLVERLVPERVPSLTRHLDRSLLEVPTVAVEAARRASLDLGSLVVSRVRAILQGVAGGRELEDESATVSEALARTRAFLGEVRSQADGDDGFFRHLSVLHALDHLDRLWEACGERDRPLGHPGAPMPGGREASLALLADAATWFSGGFAAPGEPTGGTYLDDGSASALVARAEALSRDVAEARRTHRAWLLAETAAGRAEPEAVNRRIDAVRWLDRVHYHLWRALAHLALEARPDVPVMSEVHLEG